MMVQVDRNPIFIKLRIIIFIRVNIIFVRNIYSLVCKTRLIFRFIYSSILIIRLFLIRRYLLFVLKLIFWEKTNTRKHGTTKLKSYYPRRVTLSDSRVLQL